MPKASITTTPCAVFMSNLKVRIEAAEVFYYPDVVVSCDGEDIKSSSYYLSHPKLIVEVLSPTTERVDREEKLFHYQKLDSLEEYVLVAQDSMQLWVYRKQDNHWVQEILSGEQILRLDSLGTELPLELIYEDISVG